MTNLSLLYVQVQSHLGFLASFLETQMFTTFIDDHVQAVSGWTFFTVYPWLLKVIMKFF